MGLFFGSSLISSGASIRLVQHAPTSGRNNAIWMYNTGTGRSYHYPGDMEFRIENNYINAVNHVYIEDYLCGVVPYEMSDSWRNNFV